MCEELNKEWKKAIWTIVAAAVIGIGSLFWASVTTQRVMLYRLDVIQAEQSMLRDKVDVLQIEVNTKVGSDTWEAFLSKNSKFN